MRSIHKSKDYRLYWGIMNNNELLSPSELAELLRIPVSTLYNWRYNRLGPPGFRVGRHLRYRREDVDQWLNERA